MSFSIYVYTHMSCNIICKYAYTYTVEHVMLLYDMTNDTLRMIYAPGGLRSRIFKLIGSCCYGGDYR